MFMAPITADLIKLLKFVIPGDAPLAAYCEILLWFVLCQLNHAGQGSLNGMQGIHSPSELQPFS